MKIFQKVNFIVKTVNLQSELREEYWVSQNFHVCYSIDDFD